MQRLLLKLAALQAGTAFPGRVRIVAEAAFAAAAGGEGEWHGADASETIAAAAGIALAEHGRGGTVVALVGADAAIAPALATVRALGVPLLVALAGADSDLAPYRSAGWSVCDGETVLPPSRPTVLRVHATRTTPAPPLAREWPPVRLPALRAWQHETHADVIPALAVLAARETRLALIHAHPPWSSAPATPATLIAAAAYAAEGRRVVWNLPAATDLLGWLPALRAIGERRLAMTVLLDAGDALALAHWRALPGWWVAAPGDAGEAIAVLGRALGSEDAIVVQLPRLDRAVPAWTAATDHEAGGGRWFGDPRTARGTIVCAAGSTGAALDACAALARLALEVAVFQCTSLHPLPVGELVAAAARGPLVVVDTGDGACGLAAAVAWATREGPGVAAWRGTPPGAADIAAAVRAALGI